MGKRDTYQAMKWARDLLKCSDWVILDTESTGKDPNTEEICSISIIDCQGACLMDTLVKPTIAIKPEATAVHHITNEMVADAPPFPTVHPQLCAAVKGRRVVIYSEQFDRTLIRHCCEIHQLPPPRCKGFEDALIQYSRYVGQWQHWRGDYKWQKLPGGDHTSLGDCKAVLAVLEEMARYKEVF